MPGVPNSSIGLSAQGQFIDRPTITYAPLVGERFARSMMMPMPPSAILNVIQAGFLVDVVFRLAVQAVSGVDNRRVQLQHVRPANPEFYVLLRDFRRLQASKPYRCPTTSCRQRELLTLEVRPHLAAAVEHALLNIVTVLGLDLAAREFRVVYGAVATNDKEIALLSRSIREVLVDLAAVITVQVAAMVHKEIDAAIAWEPVDAENGDMKRTPGASPQREIWASTPMWRATALDATGSETIPRGRE